MFAILSETVTQPIEPASARAARKGLSPLPRGFDDWFARCVTRNPGRRYQDADAAFSALRPVLRHRRSGRVTTLAATPLELGFLPSLERDVWLEPEPDCDPEHNHLASPGDELARHQAHAEANPLSIASCRALLSLARRTGDLDLTWRAATLLVLGGCANDQERLFASTPIGLAASTGPLDDRLWREVAHPRLDSYVASAMAVIGPALARATAMSPRADAPRPDPSLRVDPSTSESQLARAFRHTVQLLGIQEPRLYLQPLVSAPIVAVHGDPMACIIGKPLHVRHPQAEVPFILAKYLAGLRPELYVPLFIGSASGLGTLISALSRLSTGVLSGAEPLVATVARSIRDAMRPGELSLLKSTLATLKQHRDTVDLAGFIRAAELTASRAALVLSGDLGGACRTVLRGPARGLPAEEHAKELLSFWVSDTHGRIRALRANSPSPIAPTSRG